MDKKDLVYIGKVVKPHGVSGALNLKLNYEIESDQDNHPDHFFLGQVNPLPYFLEFINPANGKIICKFDEVNTKEQAELLRNKDIYVPEELFSAYFSETAEPYEQLAGYQLFDSKNKLIGVIDETFQLPHQTLAQLNINNLEVLVPLTEYTVLSIDKGKKVVIVVLPDGLLELNA